MSTLDFDIPLHCPRCDCPVTVLHPLWSVCGACVGELTQVLNGTYEWNEARADRGDDDV